jgi:hypothetical protein
MKPSDSKPRLHVMFNASGAGSLRAALAKAGRNERVVSHDDSFSFGPIDPPDARIRSDWVSGQLGYSGWVEVSATIAPFLLESLASDVAPVAWFSKRDTQSFTGFLHWLWCLGDAPCSVVDVSELQLTHNGHSRLAMSPASITPDEFIEYGLLDSATPLVGPGCAEFKALWNALKTENAPLRVLDENGLKSAPLDFFDPLILSHAQADWRKMALIVGHVLGDWMDDYRQSGDLLPASRIRALAETGKLEWRGDLYEMRNCEIRLPQNA